VNGWGAGFSGVMTLLQEASGESTFACLVNEEGHTKLAISIARVGAATTASYQAAGDHQYTFATEVQLELDHSVYDGETIHLEELSGFQNVPASLNFAIIADQDNWYSAFFFGELQFLLQPLI
jgi:hypothetical protein